MPSRRNSSRSNNCNSKFRRATRRSNNYSSSWLICRTPAASATAPNCCDAVGGLQHDVADLKTVSGNTVNELQETQKRVAALESPLAIHYKGITITPGGFLAAETVWRQRGEGADINTNLNAIPYFGSSRHTCRSSTERDASRVFRCWRRASWTT